MTRQWKNETELADMMEAASKRGPITMITSDTAYYVAAKLRAIGGKPSRDEIAMHFCPVSGKCATPCIGCRSKANAIVELYGARSG